MSRDRGEAGPWVVTAVIVPLVIAIVAGSSAPWWWDGVFGEDGAATTRATQGTLTVSPPRTATTTDTVEAPPSGCVVSTVNPLVTLKTEPDVFSQDVVRVPTGDHAVQEVQTVETPLGSERWLKLVVEGRPGWIEDSTFNIASKSAACP